MTKNVLVVFTDGLMGQILYIDKNDGKMKTYYANQEDSYSEILLKASEIKKENEAMMVVVKAPPYMVRVLELAAQYEHLEIKFVENTGGKINE